MRLTALSEKTHSMGDNAFMARAIALAKKGQSTTTPNPCVGCVIVKGEAIVGEGYHQRAGGPHAEVYALASAGENAKGATAYVTLEPCSHFGRTPPCADALVVAGVSRVVIAMLDPNPKVSGRGVAKLEAAGIEVRHTLMSEEAETLNRGFLKRMRTGRPFVQLKMAASLDGGTAMANGESQWITSPPARLDVQQFRSKACAIVTGVGTVIADNPSLNVRLADKASSDIRQPTRFILDPSGRTPVDANMVKLDGKTVVVLGPDVSTSKQKALQASGFELLVRPLQKGKTDLIDFINWLGEQAFNHVWVEAGAKLAGAFLVQQCVDEVVYYQAPIFLGANTRPVMQHAFNSLNDKIAFSVSDQRMIGPDIRWILSPH